MEGINPDTVQLLAKAALEKKAQDLVVLDVTGISAFTDYFIICHGNSHRQVQAIASEIKEKSHELGLGIKGVEGQQEGRWILIDLGDAIVHLFHKEERDFYGLERLWGDAKRIEVENLI